MKSSSKSLSKSLKFFVSSSLRYGSYSFLLEPRLSSFWIGSKLFLSALIALMTFAESSFSLQLQGLYTSACRRQIGTIVDISGGKVSLLRIDGELVKIPRYEVIFLVSYPLDRFPFRGESKLGKTDYYKIKSEVKGEIKPFVSGWPIGFTEGKVSFLNTKGNEVIVDRENIWEIEKVISGTKEIRGSRRNGRAIRFGHPYNFRNCKIRGDKSQKILYPQDVISNPITIKTVFDQLEAGHNQLDLYYREQSFYPMPLVFKNETSLGIWQDVGGRHGSSNNRTSHLTPMLEDQYASDIFDYQHQILSGSLPNLDGGHEEVQTQAIYRMKSSYFHFSAMFDPNLILVGQNYEWTRNDLDGFDDRSNDVSVLELGLDFGYLSFKAFPSHVMSTGIRLADFFIEDAVSMSGAGFEYKRKNWSVDTQFVQGTESLDDNATMEMQLSRINLRLKLSDKLRADLSALQRKVTYSDANVDYKGTSQVGAGYIYYNWNYRWTLGGYIAAESHSNSASVVGDSDSDSEMHPKAGVMTSLSF